IFDTQVRWQPQVFGIDSSGPQLIFYQHLLKEARERGIKWTPRGVPQQWNKADLIEKTLQPIAAGGRLFRPIEKECYALADEWRNFPDYTYRDALDALAGAIRLLPAVLPSHLRTMGEQQLRSYLLKTGMTDEMIKDRMAQRDQFR